MVSAAAGNLYVIRSSLSDMSDASVSTCSLISLTLHSFGLLMASATARGERGEAPTTAAKDEVGKKQ